MGTLSQAELALLSAQTPIAISPTQTKPIADIRVGDVVMSYAPTALGRGALVPCPFLL